MKMSLHHRDRIHAAHEQPRENYPMVERRGEQVRGRQEHRSASACELKGLLHGRSISELVETASIMASRAARARLHLTIRKQTHANLVV